VVRRENITGRCNDTEWQNMSANKNKNRSLLFYYDMKFEWVGAEYISFLLRGMKIGSEKGRCPVCRRDGEGVCFTCVINMFRNENLEGAILEKIWHVVNKTIINCTNAIRLRNTEK
jgi:hypothetical protein